MKSNSHSLRAFLSVLILGTCSVLLGVGCGDNDAAESPPTNNGSTTGSLPISRGIAPPVITVDLAKYTSDLGASFQVQADSLGMMASGKTLNAQQSTAYFEAQNDTAKFAVQISNMLQKNPRWLRATTESLQANTKKGIIALYHAENALKKAKEAHSAGSTTGNCPAEITKYVANKLLIIKQIQGYMSYSKEEMTLPNSNNVPAKSDSK